MKSALVTQLCAQSWSMRMWSNHGKTHLVASAALIYALPHLSIDMCHAITRCELGDKRHCRTSPRAHGRATGVPLTALICRRSNGSTGQRRD
jgi:hypothetical protein